MVRTFWCTALARSKKREILGPLSEGPHTMAPQLGLHAAHCSCAEETWSLLHSLYIWQKRLADTRITGLRSHGRFKLQKCQVVHIKWVDFVQLCRGGSASNGETSSSVT